MPEMMRNSSICLLLAFLAGCGPVSVVATQGNKVVDPEYTGFFQILGEQHLSRREYRRAWTEFSTIGDFGALRRVIETYAADVEQFDDELFESMLKEYAQGYVKQYNSTNPLAHFRERLHTVVERHLMAGSLRRANIAWTIERAYFDNLTQIEDRKAYLPAMVKLQQRTAASATEGVSDLSNKIQTELQAIRTAYHWGAK